MTEQFKAPATPAERVRDELLGALVGLARATTSEPKTDDTDEVLNAGLRLLAQPDVPEEKLQRMLSIVHTEKHRVAPNCAACAMPCGNTNDYDLARLWNAPQDVRALKLRMLAAAIRLAQQTDRRLPGIVHPCRRLGRSASPAGSAAGRRALRQVNPTRGRP